MLKYARKKEEEKIYDQDYIRDLFCFTDIWLVSDHHQINKKILAKYKLKWDSPLLDRCADGLKVPFVYIHTFQSIIKIKHSL